MSRNYQGGVSLFLTIIIMTILLSVGLGITTILLGQLRMIGGIGDSVIAFYAADTGVEHILYENKSIDPPGPSQVSGTINLETGAVATYTAQKILSGAPGCPVQYYCVRSAGLFRETRRAIEVTR